MSGYLGDKPFPYRRGQDPSRYLAKTAGLTPREVRGAGDATVQKHGDRITITSGHAARAVPSIDEYFQEFVVVEVHDDVLLCVSFKAPNDGTFQTTQPYDPNLGSSREDYVWVAKPYLLQRDPWDTETINVGGEDYVVINTGIGERTLDGTVDVEQRISPPYFVGEVIHARRCPTAFYMPIGSTEPPVSWVDANFGGRTWVDLASGAATTTCCTLAGLTSGDCLRLTRLSASGACGCSDPAVDLLMSYDIAEDGFTTTDRVTVCGVEYQPVFDIDPDGQERFGLRTTTGSSGGETVYYASRSCCCGDDCLTFALGGTICTGTRLCPATAPSQNVIRFSVKWEQCPNPLYYGPGWYVVGGVCVHYTVDPGTCVTITSGPFPTEAACGDTTPDPIACLGLTFGAGAGAGTLVISNGTGGCVCAEGVVPGNTGGSDTKVWATTTCAGNQTITLSCSGGVYVLAVNGGAAATLVSANADPFVLVYDVASANCTGSPTGTYRVTITHPGP